jgi:hypothetical protein
VGIVLARDEDVFVERAVRNVAGFCDELLLFDHRSRDDTPSILRRLADELPDAKFEPVADPAVTHERLQPYVGTDTWIFGVDGDELYDPSRLLPVRARLEAGEFDGYWTVKGSQLHCRAFDVEAGAARGWLAPPSRSTTKLYNFAALESWRGETPERLHGGTTVFAREVDETYWLRDEQPWEEAPMRCLHVCFLRRSSRQPERQKTRLSHVERIADYGRRARIRRAFATILGRPPESWWKQNKYQQGRRGDRQDQRVLPGARDVSLIANNTERALKPSRHVIFFPRRTCDRSRRSAARRCGGPASRPSR